MRPQLPGIGLFAVGLLFAIEAGRVEAAPSELKKLHILMVFDTNDEDLEPSLKIDEKRMRRFLSETIPQDRYSLTVFKGNEVTPDRILGYYRDVKPGLSDGLMFFYGGHGAKDPTKRHFFDLACNKPLVRAEVRKAMEARKAPLVLILSDCCSTPQKIAKVNKKGIEPVTPASTLHPTVRCLLFQTRGTVDVTAATNNASWSDNEQGGLFTRALCHWMTKPVAPLDANRDGFVTWREFFPRLQRETEILFQFWSKDLLARGEKISTSTQKPEFFALGTQVVQTKQTFAVVGIENRTKSLLVYRWRWVGEEEWTDVTVEPGEKQFHALPLVGKQQSMPELEAEIKGRAKAKLKAYRWTGKGEPAYEDAQCYLIGKRKK